jgi:tetratricopeptide (TPR) repeat protein
MWAKMDMAKTNVRLGNDDAVEAAVESLIADFNDQLEVANAVFQLGEEYYNRAYGELNHGRQLDSEESFRGALSVWGRVIFETADANSTIMAHAHYFSALCYRKLEDQGKAIEYFQETVGRWPEYQFSWNAQFLMARSLEELVRRKEIPPGDAAVMIRDACQAEAMEFCELMGREQ